MGNARSAIKRLRFPLDIMLLCVRWYVAYALSLRNLEEIMQERGLFVDHSTIHRWVIKPVPVLEEGNTVDFLLTAKRDGRAARLFFTRAVKKPVFPRSSTSTRAARTT